ncbi:MAG: hypothetical protein IT376_10240 [Polyangiaceae bacterium]|nr:hypothetical protein [Polyangiaceae bacterium]
MRRLVVPALIVPLALAIAGCGESDDSGSSGSATGGAAGSGSGGAAGSASGGASGASGGGGAAGSGAVPGGAVHGTVAYAGAETGALVVGVYTACPPAGPPVNLNMKRYDTPAFPQAYELTNVDPGSYYIVAVLDVGSNNPTMPGPEDLQACSGQVTVSASAGATADITLTP